MTFYTVGNPDILSMVEEFVIQEQILCDSGQF